MISGQLIPLEGKIRQDSIECGEVYLLHLSHFPSVHYNSMSGVVVESIVFTIEVLKLLARAFGHPPQGILRDA